MKRIALAFTLTGLLALTVSAQFGQESGKAGDQKSPTAKAEPKEASSVTEHTIVLNGQSIA